MYVHVCETTIQVKEYFQQLRRVFAAPSFFNFGCTGSWLWRGLLVAVRGLSLVRRARAFFCCGALGLSGFGDRSSWALQCQLGSCGTWAQLLHVMWNLP